MQIPGVVKVVVNMGVGDAARDAKLINGAVADLELITGQRPEIRRARKSIAQFKLREGMPIGARVTLRGDRMWEFLDRLVSIALPRIRDFRGLSDRRFDGNGNYTFGLNEQSMFHEINIDRSIVRAVWTSPSSPPPPTTTKAVRCCVTSASRSRQQRQGRPDMAKKALVNKAAKKPKFAVRATPGATSAAVRTRCTASSACAACLRDAGSRRRAAGRAEVQLVTPPAH